MKVRCIMTAADPLAVRLRSRAAGLSRAARRVADYVAGHPVAALASSAAEIAASLGLSDATVVRAVQALGYAGLAELRRDLAESLSPGAGAAADFRRTVADTGPDSARAVALVLQAHQAAIAALAAPDRQASLNAAIALLHPAAGIGVFGIGPSAPLAAYAGLMLTRHGRHAMVLDRTGIGLADQLLALRRGDALLVMAYGRPYREVTAVLAQARRLQLPVVLVTDRDESEVAGLAAIVLPAQRGQAGRVALHGATLVLLEALVLGLSVAGAGEAQASLERLSELREAIGGKIGRLDPPGA